MMEKYAAFEISILHGTSPVTGEAPCFEDIGIQVATNPAPPSYYLCRKEPPYVLRCSGSTPHFLLSAAQVKFVV